MAEKIYIRNAAGQLEPLDEAEFETEDLLQELIGQHPELLAGDQMSPNDPLRWILIKREMPIEGWAIDALLMDQHSCPTLVEVKRGDNRESRRAVVGQMLDYASTAAVAWSGDTMRVAFEQDAVDRGSDPHEELRTLLGYASDPDMDIAANAFWERAAANLEAGRLRLLFVSDKIPVELERSVTFWNAQTKASIEVLAVEVKQYPGQFGDALVSRVIGLVDSFHATRATSSSHRLNRAEFLERFRPDVRSALESILDAAQKSSTNVSVRIATASLAVISECSVLPRGIAIARFWVPNQANDGSFVFHQVRDSYPEEVQAILDKWVAKFVDDDFTTNVSTKWDIGVAINADNFVKNIDLLTSRLCETMSELVDL